jgi:hypothetical protein
VIIKKDLFKEDKIGLFAPDGVEFIYNVLENLGYYKDFSKNFTTEEARSHGLQSIEILCDLELIEIFSWGIHIPKISKRDFSKRELIEYLREVWFVGASTQDFYSMPMIKYKDWYLKALEEKGLTHTTHWKTFVKEEIGDLEQWIEEVRP